jgi:hypothetical protein
VIRFWGTDPKRGLDHVNYPDALYAYFQARSRDVTAIAASFETRVTVSNGTGEPERLAGTSVTPNFFATLGQAPLAGRAFRPEDAAGPRRTVAIIAHGLWQRRFGGDPGIVGRTLATPDGPVTRGSTTRSEPKSGCPSRPIRSRSTAGATTPSVASRRAARRPTRRASSPG